MRISAAKMQYFHELVGTNPAQALTELLESEPTYIDDPSFASNYGGFLIDIGMELHRKDVVSRGIELVRGSVLNASESVRPNLLYNLGNGYSALYNLARQQPGFQYDPDNESLQLAKQSYREALTHLKMIAPRLRSMIRVNYGNCLSQLGRTLEAIDAYDLALQDRPDHAMALGNLAVELNRFVNIARDPSLLLDARDSLHKALAGRKLEETGLSHARSEFERTLTKVEERLTALSNSNIHFHDKDNSLANSNLSQPPLQGYITFCVKHHLFLNFALRNRSYAHSLQDAVGFSITTDLDDEVTFYRLSRIINEVKERYVVSRLLLFEACNPPVDTQCLDKLTLYTNNLDYSVQGIRTGKLKLAFEGAYNVLDKIAFFINDYLTLGIREKDISFSSIWRERKSKTIRPTLLARKNWYLFGLYDVSRDLVAGQYLHHLNTLRNYSTHRYLVTHVEAYSWRTEVDAPEYHIGYHELLGKTLELMQLVRSAIIYLIAFIDNEERRKRQDRKGLDVPVVMPPAETWPLGPQDSRV